MGNKVNLRSTVESLVSDVIWALIDFPVKHDLTGVTADDYNILDGYGVDNLAYNTLFDYLCAEDIYETCSDLSLPDLIELLQSSDMYIEVG